MKKWYLSKFVHIFEKDGTVSLFQAIRMRPIYVSVDVYEKIKLFSNGLTIRDFFKKIPLDQKNDYEILVKNLKRLDFILENQKEDDIVIQNLLTNINKPYPHILYLMMSGGCNLACKYCFEKVDTAATLGTSIMSMEVISKSLDLFANLINSNLTLFSKEKTIIFYGGEPTLNFSGIVFALEIIKQMQIQKKLPLKLKLVLITNGTLIDSYKAKIIKKYKVNVSISLDGNKKHNKNRIFHNNHEAFEKIKEGYKVCMDLGLKTSISCTINESNINEVDSVVSEVIKNKINYMGFNILLGKTSESYQKKAAKFILDAYSIFREKGIFEDRMNRKIESFSNRKITLFDCAAAGGNQLVISPEGSIGICHGFFTERKYFIESVQKKDVNPLENSIWVEWNKRTPFNMEQCKKCPAISICGGGCPMNAEKEYESIWNIDKRCCEHSLQSLEWLIWDLYNRLTN